jgi:uncharacterized protein
MLMVELSALEREDAIIHEKDWVSTLGIDLDPGLTASPCEIYCEVSKSGGLITAKGWVAGKLRLTCDRCLKGFEKDYKSFFEVPFRPTSERFEGEAPEKVLSPDEMETVYFEGETLDIGEQVRQTLLLSVPMHSLCKEDCNGLCSLCGCDLNLEQCKCSGPPTDARWDALKNWKS